MIAVEGVCFLTTELLEKAELDKTSPNEDGVLFSEEEFE